MTAPTTVLPSQRTVLLRLDGPLQAWGAGSVFERRGTGPWPTKSAVVGLAAAALGYSRDADLSRLAALDVAVRVDQPGRPVRDWHTAGIDGWVTATGKVVRGQAKLSTRYYLADAVFVAGLGGPDVDMVDRIDHALARPVYHLFLGRRSCPPAAPIRIGTVDTDPATAVAGTAYQGRRPKPPARLILAVTNRYGTQVADQPASFAPIDRRYGLRGVSTRWVETPATDREAATQTDPYGISAGRTGQRQVPS